MEQIERNGTFIAAFACGCGRPIKRSDRTCGCCRVTGYVTLRWICNPLTDRYCWEIFMGGIAGEPIATLTCVYCMRAVVSEERRCECGAYCRFELKQQEVTATSFAPTSYRWELHCFCTTDDVPDRLDVRVVVEEAEIGFETFEAEVDSLPESSEMAEIELMTPKQKERAALREEAICLRKEHSFRKTADLLGISLGKLQYLMKED